MSTGAKAPCDSDRRRSFESIHGVDLTDAEWEFAYAMEVYKTRKRRRFPNHREVLQVLKSIGYVKQEKPNG